jgi:hypothetical protein
VTALRETLVGAATTPHRGRGRDLLVRARVTRRSLGFACLCASCLGTPSAICCQNIVIRRAADGTCRGPDIFSGSGHAVGRRTFLEIH